MFRWLVTQQQARPLRPPDDPEPSTPRARSGSVPSWRRAAAFRSARIQAAFRKRPAGYCDGPHQHSRQVDLPTIADANAYANPGGAEAHAGARTVIPVAIASALDITLARRIAVRIPDNHPTAAAGAIASPIIVADHSDWLHE